MDMDELLVETETRTGLNAIFQLRMETVFESVMTMVNSARAMRFDRT